MLDSVRNWFFVTVVMATCRGLGVRLVTCLFSRLINAQSSFRGVC